MALKTLRADLASNPQLLTRFQREARLAGSMGHDNICEVTDVGATEEGSLFLVMPLLKGAVLSALVREEGALPIPRALNIIGQILEGLEAAHGAGVVHRDLKPENIFLIRFGGREDFVKILDFGIAKELDQDARTGLTATGLVLGTPHYMAPEQARGSKEIDHRIDVYAAGVMLFEMLTGKKPYPGDSYNEVMAKILTEPFPRPRSLNPSISADLEEIVITAMAKDPADRFESAAAMRIAIENAIKDEPTSARALATPSITKIPTTFDAPAQVQAFAIAPAAAPNEGSSPPAPAEPDAHAAGSHADEPLPTSIVGHPNRRKVALAVAITAALGLAAVLIFIQQRAEDVVKPEATAPALPVIQPRPMPASVAPSSPVAAKPPEPVPPPPAIEPEETSQPAATAPKKHASKKAPDVLEGETPPDSKVKGRFGTSISSDYDE